MDSIRKRYTVSQKNESMWAVKRVENQALRGHHIFRIGCMNLIESEISRIRQNNRSYSKYYGRCDWFCKHSVWISIRTLGTAPNPRIRRLEESVCFTIREMNLWHLEIIFRKRYLLWYFIHCVKIQIYGNN